MSSLILALLSSAPLLHLAVRTSLQDAQPAVLPKAEEILARLEADGGTPDARAKAKNVVITGTVVVEGLPGEGRIEQIYSGADRVRWNMGMPGCGDGTQGTTGAYSWSSDPALGVTIREGDEQGPVQRQYAVARRAPWKSLYARAETVGRTKVGGRDVFELRMIPANGEPETWLVDAETSRLACSRHTVPDPMGGTIRLSAWPSDWKEVGGVRYPHTTKLQFGDPAAAPSPASFAIVFTVKSIEHPASIAPERVSPPAEVLAAYADPTKRTKPAPDKGGECVKTKIEARPAATVRVTIPEKDIASNLAVILPEVMGYITSVGADMAGPPFTRIHARTGGTVDMEAGFALKKKVESKGRIQSSELPGGDVAVTWHVGPYDQLEKSYAVLEAWMKEQGLASRGGHWEVYWTDPGMEPDPKKWRTQILWPVAAK